MLSGLQPRDIWIVWNVECQIAIAGLGIGIWNFLDPNKGLGMELELLESGKFHVEMISRSNDQTEAELVNSTSYVRTPSGANECQEKGTVMRKSKSRTI